MKTSQLELSDREGYQRNYNMAINERYGSKQFMEDVYDNLMNNRHHNPLDFAESDMDSCIDLDDLTITIGEFKLKFVEGEDNA